jgi:MFS family permease
LLTRYVTLIFSQCVDFRTDRKFSCAVSPLTGKLYTQFSSKVCGYSILNLRSITNDKQLTFLAFLLLFEVGSVLCGAAVSSTMLIIGRAVAGLGGSGLISGALTIIAAALPLHKRPGN